jgi:hypothetical protein
MCRIVVTALLLLGLLATPVLAQSSENCNKPAIQNLCSAACGSLCGDDASFLRANRSFCTAALANQDEAMDDAVCADILPGLAASDVETSSDGGSAPASGTSPDTGETPGLTGTAAAPPAEDCNRFESRSEQLRCIQNSKGRPTCSATAVALEDDASLLVTEVRQELSQYGELLSRDLTDTASRDLLCEFSRDELDENYNRATQDPEALRTIQRRADSIQDCRRQWEDYLRNRATSPDISDFLVEDTAEASREQFKPLIEQLENLSSSITKLEQAASTIDGLIIIHIDFCPAEGIKASVQE